MDFKYSKVRKILVNDIIEIIKKINILKNFYFNRSVMIENMLLELENSINYKNMSFQNDCLLLGVQSKVYQRLMKRPTCG